MWLVYRKKNSANSKLEGELTVEQQLLVNLHKLFLIILLFWKPFDEYFELYPCILMILTSLKEYERMN